MTDRTPEPRKRRRGRGEGGVWKRPDGRWQARLDLGWHNGRRHLKDVYGTSRADVVDKLNRLRNRQAQGLPVVLPRMRLTQWLEYWLAEIMPNEVKASTAENYQHIVRAHLIPGLGHHWLDKLNQRHLRDFYKTKLGEPGRNGRPLSARSVQYMHAILRRALEHALREDVISRNVARLVSPPPVQTRRFTPLTVEQAQQLLSWLRGDHHRHLLALTAAVNLPLADLLALRWTDINPDHAHLLAPNTLRRIDGRPQPSPSTRDNADQPIPLTPAALHALADQATAQQTLRDHAETAWPDSGLVFTTLAGHPLDPVHTGHRLDLAGRDPLYPLYVLALTLGMRKGEILALRWTDIDLDHRQLNVHATLQRVAGRLTLQTPKTKTSARPLPLPAVTARVLREHHLTQQAGPTQSGFLFATTAGTPVDPRNLGRRHEAILTEAALPRVRFHDLRHTCATLLGELGVDARVIMAILGHTDITITQNIYRHVLPHVLRNATNQLDDLLHDPRPSGHGETTPPAELT